MRRPHPRFEAVCSAALATLAVLVLAAGCASSSSPVAVEGSAADLSALAGRWEGEYESPAVGRTGSIAFELTAGEDHAHGDVLMIPRGSQTPYEPYPRPGESRVPGASPRILTIRFVRAEGGTVTGTLDPYWDPDCDCEVTTTFVGTLSGDRVEGTFSSVRQAARISGTWKATRKPSTIR